jgi:hypothetical protein
MTATQPKKCRADFKVTKVYFVKKYYRTNRIYAISRLKAVAPYMTKVKYERRFIMKTATPYDRLPKRTRKYIDELIALGCAVEYTIK